MSFTGRWYLGRWTLITLLTFPVSFAEQTPKFKVVGKSNGSRVTKPKVGEWGDNSESDTEKNIVGYGDVYEDGELVVGGFTNQYDSSQFAFARHVANGKKFMVACFTPQHDCTGLIVHLVDHADFKIKVMAYALTCPHIIAALVRAILRGVEVQVLLDKQYENKPQVAMLSQEKTAKVFVDAQPRIAHNKVILIQNKKKFSTVLITGSFNFSSSAQLHNAENIICFFNYDNLHNAYQKNWEQRRELPKTRQMTRVIAN